MSGGPPCNLSSITIPTSSIALSHPILLLWCFSLLSFCLSFFRWFVRCVSFSLSVVSVTLPFCRYFLCLYFVLSVFLSLVLSCFHPYFFLVFCRCSFFLPLCRSFFLSLSCFLPFFRSFMLYLFRYVFLGGSFFRSVFLCSSFCSFPVVLSLFISYCRSVVRSF